MRLRETEHHRRTQRAPGSAAPRSRGRGQGWARLSGALILASLLALALGAGARFVPSESPLGPLMRIADSLAPWMLGLALILALGGALARAPVAGVGVILATLAASLHLVQDHRATSLPLAQAEPDLRLLFFNVLHQNAPAADQIMTAIEAAAPDVVILAEAQGIYPALPRLRKSYAVLSPCTFEDCQLLVASRLPVTRHWHLSLNPIWPGRYAVTELETASGKRLHLAASHLVKPWMSGVAGPEIRQLAAQYDWLPGPVVALGDFNAAPWSAPLQELLRKTGFRSLRLPPATWPSQAGPWGVPIDLALVHNGARITRAQAFGAGLGSNHRGLLVDVALP